MAKPKIAISDVLFLLSLAGPAIDLVKAIVHAVKEGDADEIGPALAALTSAIAAKL